MKITGMNMLGPRILLQAEGAVVFVAACLAYGRLDASWIYFAVFFLLPDISMFGYLGGSKVGAWCYNIAHSYLGPALLCVFAYGVGETVWYIPAAIWVAHIGFDRLLGYGLKYPSGFRDTHLQRL